MKKISIKNLRSLRYILDVEIKPITVLVGKNSSGKSTFLRTFPLLKQTIDTKTSVPILWYEENYVDFGDFNESINRDTIEDTIEFGFEFETSERSIFDKRGFYTRYNFLNTDSNIKVNITFNEKYITKLLIFYDDQCIQINYAENNKVLGLYINNSEFLGEFEWTKYPTSMIPVFTSSNETTITEFFYDKFIVKLMEMSYKGTKRETIEFNSKDVLLGSKINVYKYLRNASYPKYLKDKLSEIEFDSDEFVEMNNLIVGSFIESIIDNCNALIAETAHSVRYIKPVRANVDRFYRIQGLYIDEIDASGQNIPMFLYNLNEQEKNDFERWTKDLFGLVFSTISKGGHVSLIIKDDITGEKYNLADTGYGYSQILPIIVVLWQTKKVSKSQPRLKIRKFLEFYKETNLIVIEQPELHLHPALQAKLIDIFVKVVNEMNKIEKNKVRIIFETHSEVMINRLGYLISKNLIENNNINVLIFDKVGNQETTIKSVQFSQKGLLQGWPIGFFTPEKI